MKPYPKSSGVAAQLTFLFGSEVERQHMAEQQEKQSLEATLRHARGQVRARKRLAQKIVSAKTLDYDWQKLRHVLDLPLLGHIESDLDVQADPENDTAESDVIVSSTSPEVEHSPTWTDSDVAHLAEGMIHYSLSILKSRGNAEEKSETLMWIWANDIHSYRAVQVMSNTVYQPVLRKHVPFTFAFCCAMAGLCPDRMREGLQPLLLPVLQKLGLEHIIESR